MGIETITATAIHYVWTRHQKRLSFYSCRVVFRCYWWGPEVVEKVTGKCVCVLVASLFSWFLFSLVQWFLCVSAPWLVCLCLCGSRVVSIQFILYIPIEKIVHAYNLTEYWASNANKSANAFEMLLPHSHSFVFFFSPTFSPIPSPTRILIDENRDKIWWARLGPSACKRHTKLQNFCKHIQVKWPIVV